MSTPRERWSMETERSLAEIAALDLESIRWKLTDKENGPGWSLTKTLAAEDGYRKFLILCAKYPAETIVPTGTIDEVWHNHVLHTKKYQDDCARIFGEMLHHNPQRPSTLADSERIHSDFTRTVELFVKEFGMTPQGATAFCVGRGD